MSEAREALLRALKNERVLRRMPFTGGGLPGPEPVVPIPASMLAVDREAKTFYIGLDDLIGLVREVLAPVQPRGSLGKRRRYP